LLFPPVVKVVFAADGTGVIKERLDPSTATRAIKRKRARKISDNLIQYKQIWNCEPIILADEEIILVGAVSSYTRHAGWLKTNDPSVFKNIVSHNDCVCRLALPNLDKLGI
jgi:hypothetical protein